MQRFLLLPVLVATSLAVPATAQAPSMDLARVRAAFAGADLDHDGRVTLREALAAGHSHADFRAFDADGDNVVTQDEFVVANRDRAAQRGEAVARDLDDEAARLRAARGSETRRREAVRDEDAEGTRRIDALRETRREAGIVPGRARALVESQQGSTPSTGGGANAATPANARSRAQAALSELRSRTTDPARAMERTGGLERRAGDADRVVRPSSDRPDAARPNVDPPNVVEPNADPSNVVERPNADLPNVVERPNADLPNVERPNAAGPAERRLASSPRESAAAMREVLQERRQEAAVRETRDPRAEEARSAVRSERLQRAAPAPSGSRATPERRATSREAAPARRTAPARSGALRSRSNG